MRTIAALILAVVWSISPAGANDEGKYANSPLKPWFDGLESGNGKCCSYADGRTVEDPDWGTDAAGYWVVVDGKKFSVPANALVPGPNKFGRAVVWPYMNGNGETKIRCFLPGAQG